jgi:hypothetical protein
MTSGIELPEQRSEGELHLPDASFMSPGTRLDKRLESNGITPKPNSLAIDRVDKAAYHHDLAESAFKDAKIRNQFDRIMVKEIAAIDNPTPREQLARKIFKLIINSKQMFGSGLPQNLNTDLLQKPKKCKAQTAPAKQNK